MRHPRNALAFISSTELPVKREAFVHHYLDSLDVTIAAAKTGIAAQTARNWLKDPKVQDRLQTVAGRAAERLGLDEHYVLAGMKEVAERALQSRPALSPEGLPTGVYHYDGGLALKALSEIGKVLGMTQDKQGAGPPAGTEEIIIRRYGGAET